MLKSDVYSTGLADRIRSVIAPASGSTDQPLIGIEVENMLYDADFARIPVNHGATISATDILRRLRKDSDAIAQGVGYSLEPGGQVEFASAPRVSLNELQEQCRSHQDRLETLCAREGLFTSDLSLEPFAVPEEIDLIDQSKYRLMHDRFTQTGSLGAWMMRNTTSIQVNIDVIDEATAAEMAFVCDCVAPLAAILFAHSPFQRGVATGPRNARYEIWQDTDASRCGYLMDLGAMTTVDGLVERYAEWILDVPTIFTYPTSGEDVPYPGTLGAWLTDLSDQGRVQQHDIEVALHQSFSHVRFKRNVVEIRITDRPPFGYEIAPAAFWAGLMADKTRERLLELVGAWSRDDRQRLCDAAPNLNLSQTGPQQRSLDDWMETVCELALAGLDERCATLRVGSERHLFEDFYRAFRANGIFSLQVQERFADTRGDLKTFLQSDCHPTVAGR